MTVAGTIGTAAAISLALIAQTTLPVMITAVTPKIVGAGQEITVVIRGPSEQGRKFELNVFALELSQLNLTRPTGLPRYAKTLQDNDPTVDRDKRNGIIEVRVPTDISWAPASNAPTRSRRYGLIVWEQALNGSGGNQLASIQGLQQISVTLATEIANSLPALLEQHMRLTAYTSQLKSIRADAARWRGWTSAAGQLSRGCKESCVAEHDGFLLYSQIQAGGPGATSDPGGMALANVTNGLQDELAYLYSAAVDLPDAQREVYVNKLNLLKQDISTIKQLPQK
jgi:hypothetical protein